MCGECKYGKECNGGVICQNPQSEKFDIKIDFADTCIKFRKVKEIKRKEIKPVVIEKHIANPIIKEPQNQDEFKEEAAKRINKNFQGYSIKINDEIYVIARDDHIAGFESCVNEFGGKHIFYHEEGLARAHCERLTNKKIKYTYIKCKIINIGGK